MIIIIIFRLINDLTHIMENGENKTLIFTQTKRTADDLTRFLRRDGWPALAIHGNKSQSERDWVMREFRTGSSPIMIATDIAARGLDVKDIKYGKIIIFCFISSFFFFLYVNSFIK